MSGSMAVWYLMRGSGIVSLALLTGVVALGVATWGGARLGTMPRFATIALHRSVSLLAVVFLAIHVVTAVADPYAAVSLVDVVVPFSAASAPLWVGLGALALDLIAALVVTGLLRRRIGQRAFRAIHWAAYAAWPLALLHGLGMGTDATSTWMRVAVGACVLVAAGAAAWRVYAGGDRDPAPARTPVRT